MKYCVEMAETVYFVFTLKSIGYSYEVTSFHKSMPDVDYIGPSWMKYGFVHKICLYVVSMTQEFQQDLPRSNICDICDSVFDWF